jgi:hypothetical protein
MGLALVGCGDDGDGSGDGGAGNGGASGFFAGASGASGSAGVSGSSGGGNVRTGLPSGKVLGEVTATEAQTLCDSLATSSEDAIDPVALARLPCTIAAFSSLDVVMPDGMGGVTVDRAACQASVDACLQDPPPAQTEDCDANALMAELAGCDATASDLEACLNASLPQIRTLLNQVSCNIDVNAEPPGGFEEPAACASLDMKCPGVLDVVGNVALPDLDLGDDEETGSFDGGAP